MKICLVSDNLVGYHKYWSGAELVGEILAESFKNEKEDALFFTTKTDNDLKSKKIYQIPSGAKTSRQLRKISFFFEIIIGTIFSIYYLKKEKPDIINFLHSNYLFIPVMIAAILLKIPAVFTFLDYYMICPRATFRLASGEICREKEGKICLRCISRIKFLERLIIRRLEKRLTGVVTFTETSKKRLMSSGFSDEQIAIIYTYNIPHKFKEIRREVKKDSILVTASFHEHKGLDMALKSLPDVLKKVPQAKMLVVGQGNSIDSLRIKNLVEELGVKESAVFLGQKNNEEVLNIILESEVVVVPEQWPSEFGPLALVEAMALGRPVVGSSIGSIPDFVKDGSNGFLAEYNNSGQFSEKIIRLLENKEEAQKMGERAKEAGKIIFNYDQGKKTINFYRKLLK